MCAHSSLVKIAKISPKSRMSWRRYHTHIVAKYNYELSAWYGKHYDIDRLPVGEVQHCLDGVLDGAIYWVPVAQSQRQKRRSAPIVHDSDNEADGDN